MPASEAAQPGGAGGDVLRAGDVPDPGVPERGQVGDRRPHALLVVHRDGGERVVLRGAVHQHDRDFVLGRLGEDRAARDRGREHEPVHVPGPHLVEDQLLLGQVGVGVADQRHVAVLGEPVLDAADHRREQRVVEVGDQHADRVRAAGPQAARHRVGPVAEPVGRLADPARGLLADQEPGSRGSARATRWPGARPRPWPRPAGWRACHCGPSRSLSLASRSAGGWRGQTFSRAGSTQYSPGARAARNPARDYGAGRRQ